MITESTMEYINYSHGKVHSSVVTLWRHSRKSPFFLKTLIDSVSSYMIFCSFLVFKSFMYLFVYFTYFAERLSTRLRCMWFVSPNIFHFFIVYIVFMGKVQKNVSFVGQDLYLFFVELWNSQWIMVKNFP